MGCPAAGQLPVPAETQGSVAAPVDAQIELRRRRQRRRRHHRCVAAMRTIPAPALLLLPTAMEVAEISMAQQRDATWDEDSALRRQ
jgi:hypothetical protein